jgi:hypothetical protein
MERLVLVGLLVVGCGSPLADKAENFRDTTATNLEYAGDYLAERYHAGADYLDAKTTAIGREAHERASEAGDYIHVRFKRLKEGPSAGADGKAGADGSAGKQGEQGPAGSAGPAGSNGADGAQGEMGPRGAAGSSGTGGENGEDGESCGILKKLKKKTKKNCLYDYYIVCGDERLKIKTQTEKCED